MHVIRVAPLGNGWSVTSDIMANDLIFRHGSEAEAAARYLAMKLALSGRQAEMRFVLRDGSLATSRLSPDCTGRSPGFCWEQRAAA